MLFNVNSFKELIEKVPPDSILSYLHVCFKHSASFEKKTYWQLIDTLKLFIIL